MKNKSLFILFVLVSFSFKISFAQQFKIYGNFQSIASQWIYLRYLNDGLQKQTDSAYAINGRFVFKGNVAEATSGDVITADEKIDADFFFEPGVTYITGDTVLPHSLIAMGGKSTAEYNDYYASEAPRTNERDSTYKIIDALQKKGDTTAVKNIWKEFQVIYTRHKYEEELWMAQHNNSMVCAYLIYAMYTHPANMAKGDSLLSLMSANVRQSKYISKRKIIWQQMGKTEVGSPVMHFAQNDTSGKSISTKNFSGKYFLIDFWASWCKPCREENPEVLKAYRKFHSKGFEIIGVSLDDERTRWIKAIAKDSLSWSHVSDLKAWDNAVAQLYAIRSIPENFLIDKDGKIIGKSLRGEDLSAKLEEIFGK